MADNRSLDEFMGGEESADPEPEESTMTETVEASDDDTGGDVSDAAVDPMAETFAWSSSGGECATCGESVEERWRDDGALVCGDCKAW